MDHYDGCNKVQSIKTGYINNLKAVGGLHIHSKAAVATILESPEMEIKLFHLFIMRSYFEAVRQWANEKFQLSSNSHKLKQGLADSLFMSYIGLELGMSLVHCNHMINYWLEDMFAGHMTFKNCLSQNEFQSIHSSISLSSSSLYNHEIASNDPLWHYGSLQGRFQRIAPKWQRL